MTPSVSKRAAIYARYSSDMQSVTSIDDQVRLCRRLCAERGWSVAEVFSDQAISGATHLRPGFQRMQELAMLRGFDVLVAEGLDRLSRDQEHIAGLHKRMTYQRIEIVTKAEGAISEMHIGLGGTMSALFLRQLAQKTHRGLEGRVRAGKSAGGICYGYRLDRQPLPDGTFTTGDRAIDADQAGIIRRIFAEYDAGKSARTIAAELNAEGVAPPRAGSQGWSFSTISGNWKRGTGILNNDLYIGRLVWNRQSFVKDPETGKRQARPNPPQDWIIEDVPDFRIVDQALWDRVKQRQTGIRSDIQAARAANPNAPASERGRRPKHLLSGLLQCGVCGAGYIKISATHYGCSAARNRGTCDNRRSIGRADLEARVLNGLKEKLMHPDLVRTFIAEFHQEMQKDQAGARNAREAAQNRLTKVRKEIDRLIEAITQGMYHESMKAKMVELEAERAELEEKLRAAPAPEPVTLHPRLSDIYANKVSDLAAALNTDDTRQQAAEILRGLIETIVLNPDTDAPNGHRIELCGELGAILALCEEDGGRNADARRVGGRSGQVTVVAGVGFEPTTFRL